MPTSFYKEFIVLVWSGKPEESDIWIARATGKHLAPGLVRNPFAKSVEAAWSRTEALAWVIKRLQTGTSLLLGVAAPFSLPKLDYEAYFPYHDFKPSKAEDLWRIVAGLTINDPDFLASSFPTQYGLNDYFSDVDSAGHRFQRRWRLCEQNLHDDIMPPSIFELSYPRSYTGLSWMRALRILRMIFGHRLQIWPSQRTNKVNPTLVEIYPDLFWSRVYIPASEVGNFGTLDQGLKAYGSASYQGPERFINRASSDALLSVWALRTIAVKTAYWLPKQLSANVAHQEGWIFGVS